MGGRALHLAVAKNTGRGGAAFGLLGWGTGAMLQPLCSAGGREWEDWLREGRSLRLLVILTRVLCGKPIACEGGLQNLNVNRQEWKARL